MRNNEDEAYACPSFNCYSSDRLAEIAVKVAAESSSSNEHQNDAVFEEEDFEFSLIPEDREVSADELSIGPIFPVFNRDLLPPHSDDVVSSSITENDNTSRMIPLGELFLKSREEDDVDGQQSSCSSSEADELETIPPGTYCVWRPKEAETTSQMRCRKSNSTGSASKRWRFLDLLRRSNSDGKDSFVFLTPKNREDNKLGSIGAPKKGKGKAAGSAQGSASAHEALYVRNRAVKEGERKRSYLPYRQDLVGFFSNVNGFPRF